MMHGYLAFDDEGRLLVPFRTWRDVTTSRAAHDLSGRFGFHIPERWSVSHLYQAILDGEEHVSHVRAIDTLAGYIHWRLTGRRVLSIGDASGMFPIDSHELDYDAGMIAAFNAIEPVTELGIHLEELLPHVLVAGDSAGTLTEEGAALLDRDGELQAGCPLCAPEGDAGTGMIATNSVLPHTGNVSAGTSVFSMVVLDGLPADPTTPEIDYVTTPSGAPVAMVHCNNCTSDINAWVGLLVDCCGVLGCPIDRDVAFGLLFNTALTADVDGGGIVPVPFVSGETVVGIDVGTPLLLHESNARLGAANLMRSCIMGAFAALAIGNEALVRDGVVIERLYAHGGIFKTPRVAQDILAAALDAPVTVMKTAGEGGAWGQTIAAAYLMDHGDGEKLGDYLSRVVFADQEGVTVRPSDTAVEGYRRFLSSFRRAIAVERAAERAFSEK